MSGFYEYKGYEPKGYEPELHEEPKTKSTPLPKDALPKDALPKDIKQLFNKLNTTGLAGHRDPLCVDLNYTKGKYRWNVVPEEKRVEGTPQQIQTAYQNWYVNDWKQRSRIHKIFSILYWLPSHFYRKYLTSIDYRFYYNGLVSFLGRTQKNC